MKIYTLLDGWLGEAVNDWMYHTGKHQRTNLITRADLVLTAGWRHKLPIFDVPCLNVHPSPLPAYRGARPLARQHEAQEPYIGLSVHEIDKDFDTGPIRVVRYIKMPKRWTLNEAGIMIRAVLPGVLEAALVNVGGRPQGD